MKTRRFFPAFFLIVLLFSICASPLALAEESKDIPDPDIQAKAALLVDRNSGTILYQKNKDQELYPASLTKIMTSLLVIEAVDRGDLSLDQPITASASAFSTLSDDGSSANIKVGETLTVQELLYCMLVVSANESCNILAEQVAGSVSAFVDLMNEKAQALGCQHTHFANATGLQDPQHYTSAWDLYLIATEALTHDLFMTICDTPDIVLPATNLSPQRHLYSTNYLLSSWRATGYRYPDAHGIKTGSTSDAGHCLVSSAVRGSLSLLSVVLGADKVTTPTGGTRVMSFSETSRLFDWGFQYFTYQTVLTSNDMLASMPVTLSREANSVALHAEEDVVVLMPNTLTPEDLTRTVRFQEKSIKAPVTEGTRLAEAELSYGDTVYATVPLVALNDVPASRSLVIQNQIQEFFSRAIVRVLCFLILLLVAALVIWKLTIGRQKYRYGKKVTHRRNYRGRRKPF